MKLSGQLWPTQSPKTEEVRFTLLHGMGGTGALWRPIALTLQGKLPGASIFAPDQRGHGASRPASGSFAPLDYGRDVVETLGADGLQPTWIVGHSMGVRTACAAAHLKPQFVRGLVLIDLGFAGQAGGGIGSGLESFLKTIPMMFPDRATARDYLLKNAPDLSIGQYLAAVLAPASGGVTFPFDRDALLATLDAARGSEIRTWLREAAGRGIPILALRGAQSRVWSAEDFETERRNFEDLGNQIQFEAIEGAGHGLPFEKRTEFVDRLIRFVG